jgi:hypothetical protein
MNRKISVREASLLLGLWLVQLVTKFPLFGDVHNELRVTVGLVYLALAAAIIVRQRRCVRPLLHDGLREPVAALAEG